MIKFIVDAASDITPGDIEKYGISVIPLAINFENETLKSYLQLDNEEFYKTLNASPTIPTTSLASPAEIEEIYRSIGKEHTIIQATLAGKGSGTYSSCTIMAEKLNKEGFDITVIDSETFSVGIGAPVIRAAEMAANGADKDTIIEFLRTEYKENTIYAFMNDLKNLKKGGRIRATQMVIAEILGIKPLVQVFGGLVEAREKVKGTKGAINRIAAITAEKIKPGSEVYILYGDTEARANAEALGKLVAENAKPSKITFEQAGPVITIHAGPSLVGICFKQK